MKNIGRSTGQIGGGVNTIVGFREEEEVRGTFFGERFRSS